MDGVCHIHIRHKQYLFKRHTYARCSQTRKSNNAHVSDAKTGPLTGSGTPES